jgi:predicted RNase H-like nuclease (RuvC/YqgF family)
MDTFIFILLILILGGLCYLLFKSLKKTKSQIIDDEAKINVLQNEKGELEGNRNELKSKISSLNGHIQKLNEYVEQINHHYSSLKKYEPIKNIESEVEKRWYEYLAKENEAKDSLEREINAQKVAHEGELEKLKSVIKDKNNESMRIIGLANEQATEILNNARINATSIAGDAWEAKNNAQVYQEALGAIQRRIEGYGDQWVIPNTDMLEDLADEYSFEEAGQNLKLHINHSKKLVKEGKTAVSHANTDSDDSTCLRFVTNAFNGRVDSVIAKVKHDNYGKLRKQIEDIFQLINHDSYQLFSIHVSEEYLRSRLAELEWASKTHLLKVEEREEQRMAKALLREEQKAKREYENAIKAAQNEEALLEKAMEDAQKNLNKKYKEDKERYENQLRELKMKQEMAEEQEKAALEKAMQDAQKEMEETLNKEKSQHEEQLAELQQKWEEAEERNQRAKSMAQQTKRGHVYVISNIGSFGENIYKIGMTRRLDPMDRVKELGDASVPFEFDVHAIIFSDDAPTLETKLHHAFDEKRVNKINRRKEFFKTSLTSIKELTDTEELDCHWTIKARAEQYKESVALENQAHAVS